MGGSGWGWGAFDSSQVLRMTGFNVEWKDHKGFVSVKGPGREGAKETPQGQVHRLPWVQKTGVCE